MPKSRENRRAGDVKLRLTYAEIGVSIGMRVDAVRAIAKRRGWECLRTAGRATVVVVAADDLDAERRNRTGPKRTNAKAPLQEVPCGNGCGKLILVRTNSRGFCEACRVLLRRRTTARYRETNRARLRADNLAYFYANQKRAAALRELRRAKSPDVDKATRQVWFRSHKE
jgi:lysyl-tRNA synthetase class I